MIIQEKVFDYYYRWEYELFEQCERVQMTCSMKC